jgi:hypothetical protein
VLSNLTLVAPLAAMKPPKPPGSLPCLLVSCSQQRSLLHNLNNTACIMHSSSDMPPASTPAPCITAPAALSHAPAPHLPCAPHTPQAQLADRLAEILSQLNPSSAHLYFTTFVHTMRREWFGIDRLRLDKFLLLIRRFISHMFVSLKQRSWAADTCQQYASFLRDTVLLPQPGAANRALGVAYHLSDVFVPELVKVAAESPCPGDSLLVLVEPFGLALQQAGEQATIDRIRWAPRAVYAVMLGSRCMLHWVQSIASSSCALVPQVCTSMRLREVTERCALHALMPCPTCSCQS